MPQKDTVTDPGTQRAERPGYGQLLRTRGAWTFLLPGFAARQPFAMLTISIVLLVQHTTGSYGTAGAVSATTGVAMALFAPYSGKLADRFGQRAVLLPGVLVHSAAGLTLTTLALSGAPTWALFVAAVPTGASTPQIGPMVRSRWGVKLQGSPLMQTAAAFESVTDEFTFVLGPLFATALCTGIDPAAGLITEAALTLVGGLLFAAQKGTQPPVAGPGGARARAERLRAPRPRCARPDRHVPRHRLRLRRHAGLARRVHRGDRRARPQRRPLRDLRRPATCSRASSAAPSRGRSPRSAGLLVGYTALAVMASGLWAAQSVVLLAGLGLLVGVCIAPSLITGYTLVDKIVPAGSRTEAFTWLTGAVALGQAAAVTVSGQLEDRFWDGAGFLVPMGGTVLALVVMFLLRSRLAPPSTGRTVARGVGHREPVAVD